MIAASLRRRELARLTQLIRDSELLLVHGTDPQEAVDLLGAAVARAPRFRAAVVDVDLCTSTDDLARRIVRAVADALAGDPGLIDLADDRRSPAQQKRWLQVRRALGPALDGLDDARVVSSPERLVANAVMALHGPDRPAAKRNALLLYGADSLLAVPRTRFKDADGLLWSMRSAAQSASGVLLAFAGGPAAIELVSAPEAAFLGWGRSLELQRVEEAELAAAIAGDGSLDESAGRQIAMLSEGLPRVAARLVDRTEQLLPDPGVADPVQRAWRSLLDDDASSLRLTVRLIAELHRAALPVCRALAAGHAPYSAARAAEVTRALRLLHVRGVCESPAPRQWRLANPIFAAWLRQTDTAVRHR
jgi:hypothetical protein